MSTNDKTIPNSDQERSFEFWNRRFYVKSLVATLVVVLVGGVLLVCGIFLDRHPVQEVGAFILASVAVHFIYSVFVIQREFLHEIENVLDKRDFIIQRDFLREIENLLDKRDGRRHCPKDPRWSLWGARFSDCLSTAITCNSSLTALREASIFNLRCAITSIVCEKIFVI